VALATKAGLLEPSLPESPTDTEFIIDHLAEMVVSLKFTEKQLKQLSPELRPLMQEAIPEIEEIYSAIKKVGFSERRNDRQEEWDPQEEWQKAAEKSFDESETQFKYVKREFLEDDRLYDLNVSQQRRDFEGALLRKIVRDRGLGDHGAQRLREIYQKVKN
jgi:hypothetical protein